MDADADVPPPPPVAESSSTERAPDPPEAPAVEPRRSRRRLVILGVVGAIVVTLAIVLGVSSRRGSGSNLGSGSGSSGGGGGAAIRSPFGPGLGSGSDADGVALTGFVVDGAGLPVAGAEVSAELEVGLTRAATSSGSGSGSGTGIGSGSGSGSGPPPTPFVATAAPSGPDGKFAIPGLIPGRYRVRVTGPGLLAAEVRFVPVPSDAARLVVARQVQIDGTVLDAGTPSPNAVVALRGEAIGGTIEIIADAAGTFSFPNLPEGRYQLWAYRQALAARTVRVNRLGAGPFAPVELALESATIVAGRVIDRDEGTGLAAAIELRPVGDDQAPRYARAADDGTFRIEGVPHGTWIADAYAPGYASPNGVELVAGRSIPEIALVRGATIEGRVLDGTGAPIANAIVRAQAGTAASPVEVSEDIARDKLRRFSGRTAAPTPVGGTFAGDPELIPRGELGVMVGPIPPLPPPGAAVARTAIVVDATGVGLAGEPAPLPVDPARASLWTTGPDGRYRITGLAKGKHTIVATAAGFAEGRSKATAVEGSQLVTGIDVVLSAGTFLVGRVTDQHGRPISGAQLSVRPESGLPIEGFTDPDGTYKLGPFTGKLELRAQSYGHGDARRVVELPATSSPTPDEHREDLLLALADAMIAGTLDDATGAPVGNAHVEVISGAPEGRHAIVADDGTFAIELLPAGTVRLAITHPAYPRYEVDAVANDGKTRARLRLPLGGIVEGALLDAAGTPLPNIAIEGSGPGTAVADAASDAQGRWKLGPVIPGSWKLVVKVPGFLPLSRTVVVPASRAPGETSVRDIRLDLARSAVLGGTVRDDRGARVANARVTITVGDLVAEGDTDGQGEFRIRDAPTGDLEVVATKGDKRGTTRLSVRGGDELLGLSIELR